jgi:hypothetical protein
MADEFALDEVAAFAPRASAEASGVILLLFFVDDAEADEALDAAVEVEERGAYGHEDEDWKEEVEPCPERGEVDESSEEVKKCRFFINVFGEEGHEIVGERDG